MQRSAERGLRQIRYHHINLQHDIRPAMKALGAFKATRAHSISVHQQQHRTWVVREAQLTLKRHLLDLPSTLKHYDLFGQNIDLQKTSQQTILDGLRALAHERSRIDAEIEKHQSLKEMMLPNSVGASLTVKALLMNQGLQLKAVKVEKALKAFLEMKQRFDTDGSLDQNQYQELMFVLKPYFDTSSNTFVFNFEPPYYILDYNNTI